MPMTELCAECRNWFVQDENKHEGDFAVKNGEILSLDFLQEGQYFRILGSVFNDGVYKYPTSDLKDETFEGAIWALKIPPAFIALSEQIDEYNKNSVNAVTSSLTSESFGGYSYTKGLNANGTPLTWQDVFTNQINVWRKI